MIDIVSSAKRMADTIGQVGSQRLKVLFDPANLIANSLEQDMFDYLSPQIAYFHGRDHNLKTAYQSNKQEVTYTAILLKKL